VPDCGWVRAILGNDAADRVPFLNLGVAREEWDLVRDGKRPFDFRIWRWVNLIRWTKELDVVYS